MDNASKARELVDLTACQQGLIFEIERESIPNDSRVQETMMGDNGINVPQLLEIDEENVELDPQLNGQTDHHVHVEDFYDAIYNLSLSLRMKIYRFFRLRITETCHPASNFLKQALR